ncbi:MAG: type I-E CRISPR-associated protein Cas7/Cse4/CasC [Deltaproteobacteria bacterium]|nr:type I-E CRISPR-associated protein Cas7/Cse4/CasC [Deltaproteobacteria bacterium]
MKLELHLIQNFAPSNLNRDDSGSPKDCELGGVRRARISSQCLKRAMRSAFDAHAWLDPSTRAVRIKRLVSLTAAKVAKEKGCTEDLAASAVTRAIAGAGLKTEENGKTQYLLFLPIRSIDELAAIVVEHFDALAAEAAATQPSANEDKKKGQKDRKREKADAKNAVSDDVRKAVEALLKSGAKTPELALFGRMIADSPDWNVDAACQVAHAVSTHRVSMEFDFYTAIDDARREDAAGSDMMGTIPFNSACFYRYLVVDVSDLEKNLGDASKDQARTTVEALVRAAVLAIPTGKQASMAAHNLPSLVLASVREKGESRSLANAFVKPVRPSSEEDLVTGSIQRLAGHLSAVDSVYGTGGRKDFLFVVDEDGTAGPSFAKKSGATDTKGLDGLVSSVVKAAFA